MNVPDYAFNALDGLDKPVLTDHDLAKVQQLVAAAGFSDYAQASALIARGYAKIVLDKDLKGGVDDIVAAVQVIVTANSVKSGVAADLSNADYATAAGLLLRGISKILLAKDFAGFAADAYAAAQALGIVAK